MTLLCCQLRRRNEAIALTATREWHHHRFVEVSEWVSTIVPSKCSYASMKRIWGHRRGECWPQPRSSANLFSFPGEVEPCYCSLLTHSLRRSHVKCNVVAKPTITHRRLTHKRARPKVRDYSRTTDRALLHHWLTDWGLLISEAAATCNLLPKII